MLSVQGVSYLLPHRNFLFEHIDLSASEHQKLALVGNNGSGKSTLLKIIAGQLMPHEGTVFTRRPAYYVPQTAGGTHFSTVAAALGIEEKLSALRAILAGSVAEKDFNALAEDWSVEERAIESLARWGFDNNLLNAPMSKFSGGEQMRILLAGIQLQGNGLILLDEPSNHLDVHYRQQLIRYIRDTNDTVLVVSHDRALLREFDTFCEVTPRGLVTYGGSFSFYQEQKQVQAQALENSIHASEKALRKAREKERETRERQQRLDARGKKKQEKAGLPTISMNTFRNNAENSTARLQGIHQSKIDTLRDNRNQLLAEVEGPTTIELTWKESAQLPNRVLVTCAGINHIVDGRRLWSENKTIELKSFDRVAIAGNNGSGKSSLLKIITGEFEPVVGSVKRLPLAVQYLDQDYSLLDPTATVLAQASRFNEMALPGNEIRRWLAKFLFTAEGLDRVCGSLSGGEKMRLALCCLIMKATAPDLLVLDEPTNNLDLRNTSILANAVRNYRGSLLVVSHDEDFLEEIGIERTIRL